MIYLLFSHVPLLFLSMINQQANPGINYCSFIEREICAIKKKGSSAMYI